VGLNIAPAPTSPNAPVPQVQSQGLPDYPFIGQSEDPNQQYFDDGWYLDDSGTWYRD
jgi:hypothetical protein